MLQVTLVCILDGIELVYVYQGIAVQSQLRIPALAEIDAVCVELPQFGRQDVQAISRFAASLVADQ